MYDQEFITHYKSMVLKMLKETDPVRIRLYAETIKNFAIAYSIQRRDVLGLKAQSQNL